MKKLMLGIILLLVALLIVGYRGFEKFNDRYHKMQESYRNLAWENRMLHRQIERLQYRLDDKNNGDICPVCGNDSIVEVLYGIRYLDMTDSCQGAKRYVSGGCMVSKDSPRFVCRKCRYKWGMLPLYLSTED